MRDQFLHFSPPSITEAEIQAVVEVLKSGWLSSGPKTQQFEKEFQGAVQAPAALALNSCTAGLHLGVLAHGIKEGDEVITTPLTFAATANVVEHAGGTVVLADIDPETLLIDPKEIERKITSRTRLIVPVHYAGQPCDMDAINALAHRHKVAVMEDAAHCMPSKLNGRPIGNTENLVAFSFYATKNITTGEGGMLTGATNLIDRCRFMALHGLSKGAWARFAKGGSWKYDVPEPGYKYNLTDIASAIGLEQLRRLPELYEKRMALVKYYDQQFKDSPYFRTIKVRPGAESSHHLYVIMLNPETLKISRDDFIVQMQERNIGTSVHYTPVHMFSYYQKKYGWTPQTFPQATATFENMLSIPLSSALTRKDAEDVVTAMKDIVSKFAR